MNKETMTVHKALSELKVLDDRINKAANAYPFVFANKHSNVTVNGWPIQQYIAEVKASYQSCTDLIVRRSAIKRAVMMSNAVTKVTIGGIEYTVAEAIEFKNNALPLWRGLLGKMERDNIDAQSIAKRMNGDALEAKADAYVKSLYESADMKNASDEVKKVRADFVTSQTTEIVDPVGITEAMKELKDKIDAFTVDVDSALSVSNALTTIEIEY